MGLAFPSISAKPLFPHITARARDVNCDTGYHSENNKNGLHCPSNQNGCIVYNFKDRKCDDCEVYYNMVTDRVNGDYCRIKWLIIFVLVLLTVVFCYCICGGLCRIRTCFNEKCLKCRFRRKKKLTVSSYIQTNNVNRGNAQQNVGNHNQIINASQVNQVNDNGQIQVIENQIPGVPIGDVVFIRVDDCDKKSEIGFNEIKIETNSKKSNIEYGDQEIKPKKMFEAYTPNPNIIGTYSSQPIDVLPSLNNRPLNFDQKEMNEMRTTPNWEINKPNTCHQQSSYQNQSEKLILCQQNKRDTHENVLGTAMPIIPNNIELEDGENSQHQP